MQRLVNRLNVDPNLYPNILISLTEAVNNAMQHGNRFDKSKKILVAYRGQPHLICLTISDEGSGFDHYKIPDPTTSDHVQEEGGRGVFLMKQLTDEIHFLDHGHTVELKWRI